MYRFAAFIKKGLIGNVGICTLARKMMSFCQSENIIVL